MYHKLMEPVKRTKEHATNIVTEIQIWQTYTKFSNYQISN